MEIFRNTEIKECYVYHTLDIFFLLHILTLRNNTR